MQNLEHPQQFFPKTMADYAKNKGKAVFGLNLDSYIKTFESLTDKVTNLYPNDKSAGAVQLRTKIQERLDADFVKVFENMAELGVTQNKDQSDALFEKTKALITASKNELHAKAEGDKRHHVLLDNMDKDFANFQANIALDYKRSRDTILQLERLNKNMLPDHHVPSTSPSVRALSFFMKAISPIILIATSANSGFSKYQVEWEGNTCNFNCHNEASRKAACEQIRAKLKPGQRAYIDLNVVFPGGEEAGPKNSAEYLNYATSMVANFKLGGLQFTSSASSAALSGTPALTDERAKFLSGEMHKHKVVPVSEIDPLAAKDLNERQLEWKRAKDGTVPKKGEPVVLTETEKRDFINEWLDSCHDVKIVDFDKTAKDWGRVKDLEQHLDTTKNLIYNAYLSEIHPELSAEARTEWAATARTEAFSATARTVPATPPAEDVGPAPGPGL